MLLHEALFNDERFWHNSDIPTYARKNFMTTLPTSFVLNLFGYLSMQSIY